MAESLGTFNCEKCSNKVTPTMDLNRSPVLVWEWETDPKPCCKTTQQHLRQAIG